MHALGAARTGARAQRCCTRHGTFGGRTLDHRSRIRPRRQGAPLPGPVRMTPELVPALAGALDVLDSLGLRHALVDGLAVSAWAAPRATRDADLWAELPAAVKPSLQRALEDAGFDVPAMNAELARFGVFRSRHQPTSVFVDIFDAVGPLGEAILSHRTQARLGEVHVWLASANDVAVVKAYSDRGRD